MTAEIFVPVHRLPHGADLPLPAYATEGAAGLDLLAAVPADLPIRLAAMERVVVPAGISIMLPSDHEAQVRPRSGLAAKCGLTVLNAPGTIDSDYRGEISIIMINLGAEVVTIERGMRIAQLIVARIVRLHWQENYTISETRRGEGGFGSTGVA